MKTEDTTAFIKFMPDNMSAVFEPNVEILDKSFCKENVDFTSECFNNFIILDNTTCSSKNNDLKSLNNGSESYDDKLYFLCNLCPFLCTKASKITNHLENKHKNKSLIKSVLYKCPACENKFFHKLSIRSHLVYDHHVESEDLQIILQAIVYFTKKSNDKKVKKKIENDKFLDKDAKNFEDQIKIVAVEPQNFQEGKESSFITNDNTFIDVDALVFSQEHEQIIPIEEIQKDLLNDVRLVDDEPSQQILPDGRITLSSAINSQIFSNLDSCVTDKCQVSSCKIHLQDSAKMFYHTKCHIDGGFRCLECEQTFSSWRPLTGHLWRIHKIDMELFACDKCDYKTYSLSSLNNIHKPIHNEDKPFLCKECNKSFKNAKQLANHKIVHKDVSNKIVRTCEDCSKRFSDARQLRIHVDRVHKKLKPFSCSYCGYKGASKNALRMHVRQHTGEKPFLCDTCSYSTSDHNSLRRHKLRHSGQKPYKCSYCDYACIQSSTYKVHLKTKHPGLEKDLLFLCSDCQFRSINKDIFIAHLSTVHNKKPLNFTT